MRQPKVIVLEIGDGTLGAVLDGISYCGTDVSGISDINGDGIDDIVVGAWIANKTYVVFGRSSGFPPVFELQDLLP